MLIALVRMIVGASTTPGLNNGSCNGVIIHG